MRHPISVTHTHIPTSFALSLYSTTLTRAQSSSTCPHTGQYSKNYLAPNCD
jgi:hypothetical protein